MTDLTLLDTLQGHEPELKLEIYWSRDGLLKKCLYKGMEEWLSIGENTHVKRRDKLDVYFPLVFFTALEAKKYGYIIPCNYEHEILTYNGLTCDPEDLIHVKSLLFEEVIGYHRKEDVFKCPKCKKLWLIQEEYDSHHGYNRKCSIV
jgi:hypothetical protein